MTTTVQQKKIKALADQFVRDIRSTLQNAPTPPGLRVPPARKAAKATARSSSPAAIDRVRLHAWISVNPGARSETMPKSDTKTALLKALLASGHLRTTGRARGTSYFVTKKKLKAV